MNNLRINQKFILIFGLIFLYTVLTVFVMLKVNSRFGYNEWFWISLAGLGLLTVVIGFILFKHLSRPLKKLEDFLEKIVKGDFTGSLHLERKDEFGLLAGSLNNVVRILHEKNDFLNSIPTPIVAIDNEFNVTYMNEVGARSLGKTRETVIGVKCYNLFNTTHCNTPECRCAQAMQKDGTFTGETIARLASGELPIQYTATPVKDRTGKITGALEYVADISRQKEIINDAQLKVDYLNNIPTPVMVIDREFNVEFMNPAGADAVGQTPESVKGKKCFNLFNTGHCHTANCQVAKAMNQNGVFTNDTVAKLPSGEVPIRYTGTPLKDTEGKIIGGLEYVVDISKEVEITTDVLDLAHAAAEGILKTRADEAKFEGNYQKIVQGINKTMDNITGPLNTAAEYIDKISAGDIPDLIREEYKGDFNKIKNNINSLIKAVEMITDRAIRISEGDLTVKLELRSDKDELMLALSNMVEKLQEIVQGIIDGAENVAAASQQLSSSSQQLSEGTSEQASSTEQVSSSMEEMSANIQQNTENAQQTEKISIAATDKIKEGYKSTEISVTSMKDIAEKISIINDIAFQTNILALNAAVEAARAGEHGKGFAVVAAEVRKLAERSKVAADQIDQLSRSGVEISEKAGQQLAEVVPEIEKTARLVQEISAASMEQNSGSNQINTAIQQLNKVTQQSAAASEEVATSSEELSGQAEQLKNLVAFFRLNGSGEAKNEGKNGKSGGKRTAINTRNSAKKEEVKNTKKENGLNISMADDVSDSDYISF